MSSRGDQPPRNGRDEAAGTPKGDWQPGQPPDADSGSRVDDQAGLGLHRVVGCGEHAPDLRRKLGLRTGRVEHDRKRNHRRQQQRQPNEHQPERPLAHWRMLRALRGAHASG